MKTEFSAEFLETKPRVFTIEDNGNLFYLKQDNENKRTRKSFIFYGFWILTRNLMLLPTILPANASTITFETDRLIAMKKAGINVPDVLFRNETYFIMSDSGESAEKYLAEHPDEAVKILDDIARETAKFHAAGFAHGGSQIRNYTVKNHQVGMIDFEDNVVNKKHLFDYQVRDLMVLLQSLQRINYPIDLVRFFKIYDETIGDDRHRQRFIRYLRRYTWFAWLSERKCFDKHRWRDIRRFVSLINSANKEL